MLCALEATSFPLGSEVRVQRTRLSGNTSVWGAERGVTAVGGQSEPKVTTLLFKATEHSIKEPQGEDR